MAGKTKGKAADLFDQTEGKEMSGEASFWKPEEGNVVGGRYEAKRDGKYGPVAELRLASGKVLLVGLNPDLDRKLNLDTVGKNVLVRFDGQVPTSSGQMMNVYSVKLVEQLPPWLEDDDLPF